jgi:hypothetical protein
MKPRTFRPKKFLLNERVLKRKWAARFMSMIVSVALKKVYLNGLRRIFIIIIIGRFYI